MSTSAAAIALAMVLSASPARANITFNLIPEPNTPQFVIDGFNAAANIWSAVLADNITVNIQVGYTSLGPQVLGDAASAFIETSYTQMLQSLADSRTSADDFSSYAALQIGTNYHRLINHTSDNPNGANSGVPYVDTMDRVGLTTANAKALGLIGPNSALDGLIRFSSDFAFDFSHGPTIAPGHFDFVGIAAHEIGHILGFVSGVDDIDTLNGQFPGEDFSSNLLDLFRYSDASLAAGAGFTDYTADTRDKFFSVDGGLTPIAAFSEGAVFGDGRQASHWKEGIPPIGLLDPTASPGERLDLSPTDLRPYDVMGYEIVPEPSMMALFSLMVALFAWRKATQSS